MVWMEKQLESLTELVKELTRERTHNEQQLCTRTGTYKGIVISFLIFLQLKKYSFER